MVGVLDGIKIVEMAGLGPAPFCGMMLADHGAEVIRVERPGAVLAEGDCLARNRKSITLDLKKPEAVAVMLDLCRDADGLIEGYRPGVMERLGLGPEQLTIINSRLVIGRMTGWGQHGPLAEAPGHDINYIATTGILHTIGDRNGPPSIPANYVGDIAGGGMMLAFGMVSALLSVRMGNPGQVIDCAMTDGSAAISATIWSLVNSGKWRTERGTNVIDGGAHFYGVYECADGRYVAIGPAEPQFYAVLRAALSLDDPDFDEQRDQSRWPILREKLAKVFLTRSRAEWSALLEGSDACLSPVLSPLEATFHPHNVARETFVTIGGHIHPAPAPRFSNNAFDTLRPSARPGVDTVDVLKRLGYDDGRIDQLIANGAIRR